MQRDMNYCFICGKYGTHKHEIFFGSADRKNSIKYGMVVGLCPEHHNISAKGVHMNIKADTWLKRKGQKRFEEVFGHEMFMEVFHRNYLEE